MKNVYLNFYKSTGQTALFAVEFKSIQIMIEDKINLYFIMK